MNFNHNRDPQETAQMNHVSDWGVLIEENQSETQMEPNLESIFGSELFDLAHQQAVLDSITSPTDTPEGIEHTMDDLRTKHELRILAEMSHSGFNNWDQLDSDALRTFITIFPSPADFDGASHNFLDEIEEFNGPEKRAQYELAMKNFKRKVYGEKQTYYEQMKAINALRVQSSPAQSVEQPIYSEQHQTERSAEWTPGLVGISQISRTQVGQGISFDRLLNGPSPDQTCQDSCLIRRDESLFGVFDGAGGHNGGRDASIAAANSINQACDKYNLKSGSDLAYILNAANQPVQDATNGQGYTTAIIAKIIDRDGQKQLAYASVGDSRLYLVHSNGYTELVTKDEGEGNRITNALGVKGDDRTKQYGEIPVQSGDKVVLCSDGITGDFGDDLMSNEELGSIVMDGQTPEEAAANLVVSARKTDDRTAIVFAI